MSAFTQGMWTRSGGLPEFNTQIEQATSSSLEDIALNLEISDLIRSKTVLPRDAMRSLKKRISNPNPNVQLATLTLIDTCVKNGGSHFLQEIAAREFMDNFVSLVRQEELNPEVRNRILALIQSWATAAEGRYNIIYINETYRSLHREGFRFPPKENLASSMFDSSAPPEWADSDVCMRCRTSFTFTNRKHHCRNCGNVFCGACSSKSISLPHLGITDKEVRVDDGCHAKLTDKDRDRRRTSSSPWDFSSTNSARSRMQPRSARIDDGADADLKRALQMSLEDAKEATGSGFVSQSRPQTNGASKPSRVKEDDEDSELKAAIAASLQDMEEQKKKHAAELKEQSSRARAPAAAARTTRNDYELTPVEAENINLFSTLVDRLQHQAPGTVLREPQIQELYESIGTLRPKLARSYGETMSKHDTLLDLHSKLATVVRYYDRMLEDRLNNTYNAPGYAYAAPPASAFQQSSSMYPNLMPQNQNAYPQPQSNMENYYTGGPAGPDSFARPQSIYSNGPQAHAQQPYAQHPHQYTPQQRPQSTYNGEHYSPQQPPQQGPASPYAQRQRQSSTSTVSSQRAPSLKYRQSSLDQVPMAPKRQLSTYGQNSQPGYPASQDPNASYYYANGNTPQPDSGNSSTNLYPTLKSPPVEAPPPSQYQQTFQPALPQHFQQPPPNAQPQYNSQAYTSQQQPLQHFSMQSQYPQHNPSSSMAPSMFPSAPTHQPVAAQPAPQRVEESLIEL